MAFILTLIMTTWYRMENARRDKVAAALGPRDLTPEERLAERDLGDDASYFRYII